MKKPGVNWKEFAISHGEKLVLGLVCAFALYSVVSTDWKTYEKTPEDFTKKIDQAKSAYASSTWPMQDEEQAFASRDPGDEVVTLLAGLDQRYWQEYSYPYYISPVPRKAKLKEPQLYKVQEVYADAGKALLELQKDATPTGAPGLTVVMAENEGVPSAAGGSSVAGPSHCRSARFGRRPNIHVR
jgi:hypothetical protein